MAEHSRVATCFDASATWTRELPRPVLDYPDALLRVDRDPLRPTLNAFSMPWSGRDGDAE